MATSEISSIYTKGGQNTKFSMVCDSVHLLLIIWPFINFFFFAHAKFFRFYVRVLYMGNYGLPKLLYCEVEFCYKEVGFMQRFVIWEIYFISYLMLHTASCIMSADSEIALMAT